RDDGLHAAVPAGAARRTHSHLTRGEVQVVVHDQQILRAASVIAQQRLHGLAAQVHVCHGLDEEQLAPTQICLGHRAAHPAAPAMGVKLACQPVNDEKAHVVAGAFVSGAGIAQADDELQRHYSLSAPSSAPPSAASPSSAASASSTRGGVTVTTVSSG